MVLPSYSGAMSSETEKTPDTAVWYFVAATLIFALPPMFFDGEPPVISEWAWRAGGVLTMMLGFITWRRERRLRQSAAPSSP